MNIRKIPPSNSRYRPASFPFHQSTSPVGTSEPPPPVAPESAPPGRPKVDQVVTNKQQVHPPGSWHIKFLALLGATRRAASHTQENKERRVETTDLTQPSPHSFSHVVVIRSRAVPEARRLKKSRHGAGGAGRAARARTSAAGHLFLVLKIRNP